jgi:hypothetical protein
VLHASPLAVLVPHLLGLIALRDFVNVGPAVLALLAPHEVPKITVTSIGSGRRALTHIFWGGALDAHRLAMVLAQWGEVSRLHQDLGPAAACGDVEVFRCGPGKPRQSCPYRGCIHTRPGWRGMFCGFS